MFDERKKKEKEKKEGKKADSRDRLYSLEKTVQRCEQRAIYYRCSVLWADFTATGKWQVTTTRIFCFRTLDRKPRLQSQILHRTYGIEPTTVGDV